MQHPCRQYVVDATARASCPGLLADQGLALAAPQDHGMNPGVLARIDEQSRTAFPGLRSVLVVRGGDLVVERYYHGSTATDLVGEVILPAISK